MFDIVVILYLFLGGCGGGLLLVSVAWSLIFHQSQQRTQEATQAFGVLTKHCYVLALLLIVFAAICLTIDLEQPSRVLLLFTRPSWSVLSIGSFILLISLVLAIALLLINGFGLLRAPSALKKALEVFAGIFALLLITYVGVFLQSIYAVPFWRSLVLPVLLVISSLSAGMSLLLLIAAFTAGTEWLKMRVARVSVWYRLILLFEALALLLLLWQATLHPTAQRSLEMIMGPELQLWFYVGAVTLGLAVPLLAEVYGIITRRASIFPPFYVMFLLGNFCLRYCIVAAGVH